MRSTMSVEIRCREKEYSHNAREDSNRDSDES